MRLKRKSRVLAIFSIGEESESHGIEDDVASNDCFDRDVDGVRRRKFLRCEFWNNTRASPQICVAALYVFYNRGDGLAADDDANVNVLAPTGVVEQSIDRDRSSATAHEGRITEDVEHFLPRYRKVRDWMR